VDESPNQWQAASPVGARCVFCRRLIEEEAGAKAVWDLDQDQGWQILAYHERCRDEADRLRRA
jgi:hypothetical protein